MPYVVVTIVIGRLIAIHEYGHLLAAKLCRIPVKRFSVGFGPKVFGFKVGKTSYWMSCRRLADCPGTLFRAPGSGARLSAILCGDTRVSQTHAAGSAADCGRA